MATYDLAYPGAAIDAILNTAYYLQEAGYIFRGSASDYSGTPSKREWVIAPAGFTGYGISSPVPQGSIGICLYNGTSWVGKIINVATIDSTPTQNSGNAVSSGGVYAAIMQLSASVTEALENLTFTDTTPSAFQDKYINMKVSTTEGGVERILTYLTILAATTSKAGLMSAEDKAKVDSFLTGIRSMQFVDATTSAEQSIKLVEQLKWTVGGVQEVIDSITILAATSSKAGLLSASDKAYIDALPATLTNLSNSISGALALMQSLVGYYVCDTAAGTAAKTVAATGYSLTSGGCIRVKMNNANTANNVTLNINSTGAKALYYDGAQASATNTWEAGEVLEVYYDGTQYQCASGGGGKFASGQKVKEISLLDNLDSSGNLPKSSAVKSETDNLYANIGLFECSTANGTAAKTVSATGYKLTTGGHILVRMTNENTAANPTLNINKTGAKPLFYYGERASSTNSWNAGDLLVMYYDGTNYTAMLYDADAKHIVLDGTISGLPSNVQDAIDSLSQSVFEMNPSNPSTSGLRCESTNQSKITVVNTSENNYEITSIEQKTQVYGKIFLPPMVDGVKYRMTFSYTNTNTGSQDWSIRSSRNADIIRPAQMVYTTEQTDYSWDFEYTSNMAYLNFFCNNMVSGSKISIYNLQFTCLENYNTLKETVKDLSNVVDSVILPPVIDTNNLSCNSNNAEKFTVVCVSDNNYLINSIEKTGYVYGFIQLPELVVGRSYRISFYVTSNNEKPVRVALSNSTGAYSVIHRFIQKQENGLLYFDFTYRESSKSSYLEFFCNDIDSGNSIALNDLRIYDPDSLTAISNEVNPTLVDTQYVYPATRKIDLKTNNYGFTKTKATWSVPNGQSLAFYGNYIVRIPANGKLTLLYLSGDTVTTVFESPEILEGHNNSAQFAPYKDANDEFPLLYVSAFNNNNTGNICKVYRLTTNSVTLVQTITFDLPSNIDSGDCNTQIGDDGCLYMYNFQTGVAKLTTPDINVSNVVLNIENVIDYFWFNYPRPQYVLQGGAIYKGLLFLPCGYSQGTYNELFVYDLANHALLTKVNVDTWPGEPEDCDIHDGKLYVSTLTGGIIIVDFL